MAVPVPQLLAGSVRRHYCETLMLYLLSLIAHGERDLLCRLQSSFAHSWVSVTWFTVFIKNIGYTIFRKDVFNIYI
jgi:hypothetical protein